MNRCRAAACVLALAAAAPVLHPVTSAILAPRVLSLTVRGAAAGDWSVHFTPPKGEPANGWWLQPGADGAARAELPVPPGDPATAVVRAAGGDADIEAMATTRVGSRMVRRDVGVVTRAAGAPEWSVALPPRPWMTGWPLRVGVAALVFGAVYGVALLFAALASRIDARRAPQRVPGPPSRRAVWLLRIATVIGVVGPPLWVASWAPMIAGGDSGDYVSMAARFPRESALAIYNGFRLPGYAVFLSPFLHAFPRFEMAAGLAQAGLVIAAAALVFDFVRRRASRPWPHIAAVLISFDPVHLALARVLLSESIATSLVVALVWLADRTLAARRWPAAVALAVLTGLVGGASCYVRGNFQIAPLVLAFVFLVGCAWRRQRWRGLALAGACIGAAALLTLPAFVRNHTQKGVASFVVGAGCTRVVFAWLNGTCDYNQTRAFTPEQHRAVRERAPTLDEWGFCNLLDTGSAMAAPYTDGWAARDYRAAEVVSESFHRRPGLFARRAGESVLVHLGVPLRTQAHYIGFTEGLFTPMRGRLTPERAAFRRAAAPGRGEPVAGIITRSVSRGEALRTDNNARTFDAMYLFWLYARPAALLLLPIAAWRLLWRRDAAGLAAIALIGANAVAVAVLSGGGESRYGMPFWPLMSALAVLSVAPLIQKSQPSSTK